MKTNWLAGGVLGIVLLAGCASHDYADRDDRYHHHRWSEREHRERYQGRPPGYYQGGQTEIYVTPADPARPNRW